MDTELNAGDSMLNREQLQLSKEPGLEGNMDKMQGDKQYGISTICQRSVEDHAPSPAIDQTCIIEAMYN